MNRNIGTPRIPTTSAAPGIWDLRDQFGYKKDDIWTLPNSLITIFNSATTTSSTTVTLPANIQNGDLILFADNASNQSSTFPEEVIPSGFTKIYSQTLQFTAFFTFSVRYTLSYKIASSSDSSTVVTGQSGSTTMTKDAVVYRDILPISSIFVSTPTVEASTNNTAAQTINMPTFTKRGMGVGVFTTGNNSLGTPQTAVPIFSKTPDTTFSFDIVRKILTKMNEPNLGNIEADLQDNSSVTKFLATFYMEFN